MGDCLVEASALDIIMVNGHGCPLLLRDGRKRPTVTAHLHKAPCFCSVLQQLPNKPSWRFIISKPNYATLNF